LNGEDSYRNEWFAVNRHRHNLKNAYDTYRYGNLRPLVASFLADLDIRDKMKFGPDPDWWGPDV
jgi:hypothetical protein